MSHTLAAHLFAHTAQRLSIFDLALIALYLIGITLFGLRFREKKNGVKQDKSLKSYFLANNTIPWWAIALSIVSAETSTLTIISIPGVAFAGDFGFLQLVIGYMIGRVVVALLFLPRYFAGEMLTAYQLIDRRFGNVLHKTTAGLFLLTRAAAEGVRVFAVSIVVAIAIGTGNVLSIAIISGLTLLYTFEGGMAAVIWTDVVQMILYIAGTVVAIITLGTHVPGGWSAIHTVAAAAGKFHTLHFAFNLTQDYTFWAGVLGGTFLTMGSHGTDQLMVQRMLAARNLRQSQIALLSSGVIIFVQFSLFLLIGAGLYVFYGLHPTTFASADRIFPTFIVREMPVGIAGLLVAAILAAAMSNLSAALNSLSSTTVVDFYMHFRPNAPDRERTIISKSSTVLWALVLFAIAVYSIQAGGKGHVVEIGLSIAAVAYGCLLGVFLLGTLTKFATETGAAVGMVCGFALNLWLWQGDFPVHLGPITIPHIAFTWYVLIGAFVTFAIGSLSSLIFRKQSVRKTTITAAALLLLFGFPFRSAAQESASPAPDFSTVTTLINDAIAAHKLPGAVVIVGHNGKQVFEHAYGNRKLADQPGLDGKPSPAELMTEDTIFDMASLTKDLATATAVMQLYDAGKIHFDDPVEKYLPAFNPTHDPIRAKVTLRMLLTHFSGEGPDISLKAPWGLAAPDRAEGFRLALSTPLHAAPGAHFRYSDINFILLGDLVETLTHEPEYLYVRQHIYEPLGMTDSRYLPLALACGPWSSLPVYSRDALHKPASGTIPCDQPGSWNASLLLPRIAPTAHDDESKSNPSANPNFDVLLRGTVDDPTTRRMGGVAGHAGLFSTAHDVSLFANALLEKLLYNKGPFPVRQSTLKLMMQPEQPGHNAGQIPAAQEAQEAALEAGERGVEPGLAPHYPSLKGQDLRGYGWDIDTAFSKPRGMIFPIGSFGHTGYTGTTLWMDSGSDTYVVLLANAIHPHVGKAISDLRGEVSTSVAFALHLYPHTTKIEAPALTDFDHTSANAPTLTGIDVLEQSNYAALTFLAQHNHDHLNIGLLTNQTGVDSHGHRTLDLLHSLTADNIHLTALFSPEHGIFGKQDSTHINSEVDPATGMHVTSLYGSGAASRHPTHEQLKDLDAVVIDIQDAGVHYWTYEAAMGYFLEAASTEENEYHHKLTILVLDRPNPLGGVAIQGPIVDADRTSYVAYMQLPVRHGFTLGELARYIVATKHLDTLLTVVPMQHWHRDEFYAQTGLPWINPSPNLRSPEAAILYPALGLIEPTNVSVGRGTAHPFSFFGAGIPNSKETAIQAPIRAIRATGPNTTTDLSSDMCEIPLQHKQGESLHILRVEAISTSPTDGTYDDEGDGQGEFDTVKLEQVLQSPIRWTPNFVFRVHPYSGMNHGSSSSAPEHLIPGREYILVYTYWLDQEPSVTSGSDLIGLTRCGAFQYTSELESQILRGRAWFNAPTVAAYLTDRHIPGVTFTPTTEHIDEDANHYPYHGQTIQAVHVTCTNPAVLNTPELGIEILSALHHLYPTQFHLARAITLIDNRATMDALNRSEDPRAIAASWQPSLNAFRAAGKEFLLYN